MNSEHNRDFILPVGDLLRSLGAKDLLELEGIRLPSLEKSHGFCSEGIRGEVELQALDEQSVLVRLHQLEVKCTVISEISGKPYSFSLRVPSYSAKFVKSFSDPEDLHREVFDEEFPIDTKNESINIHTMVQQALLLQRPTILATPEEREQQEQTGWEEDQENNTDHNLTGTVRIRKMS